MARDRRRQKYHRRPASREQADDDRARLPGEAMHRHRRASTAPCRSSRGASGRSRALGKPLKHEAGRPGQAQASARTTPTWRRDSRIGALLPLGIKQPCRSPTPPSAAGAAGLSANPSERPRGGPSRSVWRLGSAAMGYSTDTKLRATRNIIAHRSDPAIRVREKASRSAASGRGPPIASPSERRVEGNARVAGSSCNSTGS